MILKSGVILYPLDIRMRQALITADRIYKNYHPEGVTITSGLEGSHSPGSLHYYGLAIDIRTRYFSSEELSSVFEQLQECLQESYDVILEPTHIHIEWRLITHGDLNVL